MARDHGSPTSYETLRVLTINLLDANDNNPEFPRGPLANPYHFNAPENAPANVRIGKYFIYPSPLLVYYSLLPRLKLDCF